MALQVMLQPLRVEQVLSVRLQQRQLGMAIWEFCHLLPEPELVC